MEKNDYESYLAGLKGINVPLDDKIMFSRIKERIKKRSYQTRLALAFAVTAISIGLLTYFNADSFLPSGSEIFSDYIFQQKDASSDSIIAYVLADQ